jgi:hypothetical protein
MNDDDLRETIWEDLFRAKMARTMEEIAALTDRDVSDVRAAVNHEWFTVADDRVAIAYTATGMNAN